MDRHDKSERASGTGTVSLDYGVILSDGGVLGVAKGNPDAGYIATLDSGSVWPIDYNEVVPETLNKYPGLGNGSFEQMLAKFATQKQITLSGF